MSVTKVFSISNYGLEQICANEMSSIEGTNILKLSYRRILASIEGPLDPLLTLKTADDVFVYLDTWDNIDNKRMALQRITELSSKLDIRWGINVISQVRKIKLPPSYSVTANFVGKRNYSTNEIKNAVARGVEKSNKNLTFLMDDQICELNLRIFIEHDQADVGLRLSATPLNKRAYKYSHIVGSLNPPVAAALIQLSGANKNSIILDPFCGAGTILIEAISAGYSPIGGDQDLNAIKSAIKNATLAGYQIPLCFWDAQQLPLRTSSIDCIISNLPWGRQVHIDQSASRFYLRICTEFERVLSSDGTIILLTTSPELIKLSNLKVRNRIPISLFGQSPTILVIG